MSDWPNDHFYQQLLKMRTEFISSLLISADVMFDAVLQKLAISYLT